MKRIVILTVAFLTAFAMCFTASGVNVDGNNQGVEWDGATTYKLFDGESNSSVNFGAVKAKFVPDEYSVFLCLMFKDPMLEKGNTLAGISLTVENSSPFVLTMAHSPCFSNSEEYDFSGAMYIDEHNGGTCEVGIHISSGLPQKIECAVRFIDYAGTLSDCFYFTLVNELAGETTVKQIQPTADNPDPAYNPETTAPKVTKTTTQRTTKETTAKETTERTTKAPKTTKPPKTTKEQESQTATRPPTVYYYEKEVIISQVYVTQSVLQTTQATLQTETSTDITTEPQTTRILTSDGVKYKKIAAAVCGAGFIAVAAWGVVSARKGKSA